jgi:hypothetical protein
MNKVVFIKAYFAPVGEEKNVQVPTGKKKKGLFGQEVDEMRWEKKWVQTGFSDKQIDTTRLTKDLQEAVERLNKEGYEVISVIDVISGNYNWGASTGIDRSYGYGYGYSYTDGLIVVARKV